MYEIDPDDLDLESLENDETIIAASQLQQQQQQQYSSYDDDDDDDEILDEERYNPHEACSSSSNNAGGEQHLHHHHEHEHSAVSQESSYHSMSYAYNTYLRHDKDEQNHWQDVCRAYRLYATFAMSQWANHQYRLHALPESQRALLPVGLRRDTPEFVARANAYKEAAIRNQFCLDCILRHAGQPISQQLLEQSTAEMPKATDAQMSKVSSVLKSLVRDWSAEGKPERDMAYKPILQHLQSFVPIPKNSTINGGTIRAPPRVCVPGAGVGRLALEISALGYSCQGNEFSLYMLLASDFVLNAGIATPQTPLKISPWLLETRNVHQYLDPCRVVQVPDVDPHEMIKNSYEHPHGAAGGGPNGTDNEKNGNRPGGPNGSSNGSQQQLQQQQQQEAVLLQRDFSMAAGEFVSIYGTERERGQWDAVVACFFLDTSPSIVEYLQVIHRMLKPGGFLINFGPLLWHWSGPAMRPDDGSVQDYHRRYTYLDKKYLESVDLCWEDIQEILGNVGFEILDSSSGKRALYTSDRRSMMNMEYRCVSFVARKKHTAPRQGNSSVLPTEQPLPPSQQQQVPPKPAIPAPNGDKHQQQVKQTISDGDSMSS